MPSLAEIQADTADAFLALGALAVAATIGGHTLDCLRCRESAAPFALPEELLPRYQLTLLLPVGTVTPKPADTCTLADHAAPYSVLLVDPMPGYWRLRLGSHYLP